MLRYMLLFCLWLGGIQATDSPNHNGQEDVGTSPNTTSPQGGDLTMSFIFVGSKDSSIPSAPQTSAPPALTPPYVPQSQTQEAPITSSNSSAASYESSTFQTPIPQSFRDLYELIKSRSLPDDHVPIEVFLQPPGWYKYTKANLGFGIKRAMTAVTNVLAAFPIQVMNINAAVGYAASTGLDTVGQTVIGADVANFPDIPLSNVVKLLSKINNRKELEKISIFERMIRFKRDGFMGYDGVLIIKDLAHGERLVSPGSESIEIANSKGKNPLDKLVALKDGTSPMGWYDQRFVRTTPAILRKIPYTYKNDATRSCLIFELPADPDVMLVETIRISEQEFGEALDVWEQCKKKALEERSSNSSKVGNQ